MTSSAASRLSLRPLWRSRISILTSYSTLLVWIQTEPMQSLQPKMLPTQLPSTLSTLPLPPHSSNKTVKTNKHLQMVTTPSPPSCEALMHLTYRIYPNLVSMSKYLQQTLAKPQKSIDLFFALPCFHFSETLAFPRQS